MTLGDMVKKYRNENNLSMDEFALKSGLSKGYISMLEKNKNPRNGKKIIPSIETIKKVSLAIGENFNSVLSKLDAEQEISMLATDVEDESCLSNKEILIQHYNKLNKVGQNEAVKRVEELTFIDKYRKSLKNTAHTAKLELVGRQGKKSVEVDKEKARKGLDYDNKNRKPIPPNVF